MLHRCFCPSTVEESKINELNRLAKLAEQFGSLGNRKTKTENSCVRVNFINIVKLEIKTLKMSTEVGLIQITNLDWINILEMFCRKLISNEYRRVVVKLKDRQTRRIIRVFFNLQLRKKLVILEFKQLIKKLKENTERGIDGSLNRTIFG